MRPQKEDLHDACALDASGVEDCYGGVVTGETFHDELFGVFSWYLEYCSWRSGAGWGYVALDGVVGRVPGDHLEVQVLLGSAFIGGTYYDEV